MLPFVPRVRYSCQQKCKIQGHEIMCVCSSAIQMLKSRKSQRCNQHSQVQHDHLEHRLNFIKGQHLVVQKGLWSPLIIALCSCFSSDLLYIPPCTLPDQLVSAARPPLVMLKRQLHICADNLCTEWARSNDMFRLHPVNSWVRGQLQGTSRLAGFLQ